MLLQTIPVLFIFGGLSIIIFLILRLMDSFKKLNHEMSFCIEVLNSKTEVLKNSVACDERFKTMRKEIMSLGVTQKLLNDVIIRLSNSAYEMENKRKREAEDVISIVVDSVARNVCHVKDEEAEG